MSSVEKISLTLAIEDVEDRDLALQKVSKEFVANGDLEKAIGVTHFIEASYEKVEALHLIAEALAEAGDLERSFWFFNEAEIVAVRCDELWQQAELLHKLAKTLFQFGAKSKAERIWDKAVSICRIGETSKNQQSSLDASSVLKEIINFSAKNLDLQKAANLAQSIKNPHHKEQTQRKIADYQSQIQLVA